MEPRRSGRNCFELFNLSGDQLTIPGLWNDSYQNLLDWSSQSIVAVGAGAFVCYMKGGLDTPYWIDHQMNIIRADADLANFVTSVQWNESGGLLAAGTKDGKIQIWDPETQQIVCERAEKNGFARCLAWNETIIGSGSDGPITLWDIRQPPSILWKLCDQERNEANAPPAGSDAIGLKWSPDRQQLASTGLDAVVNIWDLRLQNPCCTFTEHARGHDFETGVKALAWSPHDRGLLVTGGGLEDGNLRFWDTAGVPLQRMDVESAICGIAWSKLSNELVTTDERDGVYQLYSWKYPKLQRNLVTSQPKAGRILRMALSPDSQSIVTADSLEKLEFWRAFPILCYDSDIDK